MKPALEAAKRKGHSPNVGAKSIPKQIELIGSPETIRKHLENYEALGVQELSLIFPDALKLEPIQRFAREFIASV
jgi:hypothetical protein